MRRPVVSQQWWVGSGESAVMSRPTPGYCGIIALAHCISTIASAHCISNILRHPTTRRFLSNFVAAWHLLSTASFQSRISLLLMWSLKVTFQWPRGWNHRKFPCQGGRDRVVMLPMDKGGSCDNILPAWVRSCREAYSQISYTNPSLDKIPSMCHSGLPLPPQGVYKEHGEDLSRIVLNQAERSPFVPQSQPRGNAWRGESLLQKTPSWNSPMTQGHRPINGFSRFLVLATTRLRHLLQPCFMCLIRQAPLSLRVVFLGLKVVCVATACFKLLHEISCPFCKPASLLDSKSDKP